MRAGSLEFRQGSPAGEGLYTKGATPVCRALPLLTERTAPLLPREKLSTLVTFGSVRGSRGGPEGGPFTSLDGADGALVAAGEVVYAGDGVAVLQQPKRGVRTDEARAPNQRAHHRGDTQTRLLGLHPGRNPTVQLYQSYCPRPVAGSRNLNSYVEGVDILM
eukprot:1195127-Prorocentrum_minimum.AAC.6